MGNITKENNIKIAKNKKNIKFLKSKDPMFDKNNDFNKENCAKMSKIDDNYEFKSNFVPDKGLILAKSTSIALFIVLITIAIIFLIIYLIK